MKKSIAVALACLTLQQGVWSAERSLHYRPDGQSVVAINGETRFNRALYGAHSGFRMECSDLPEFGIYLPRMGGNLLIGLPQGECTARYTPGRMDYTQGGLSVEAQVLRSRDGALWAVTNHTAAPVTVPIRFGGVADKKFWREGDLGVDAPDCFDLKPEYCTGNLYTISGDTVRITYGKKERSELTLLLPAGTYAVDSLPALSGSFTLSPGASAFIGLFPPGSDPTDPAALIREAEAERSQLASTISFTTPDPWLNPIAGALSIAADGIWSGQAWLHGAIGWRTPHLGWRGAYAGDAIGWHDRAMTHFRTYAANQVTDRPAVLAHPRQDSTLCLARAEKRWGTPMYSDGYICRRPGKKDEMSHYDMNLVYIDALMRHFRHTGSIDEMRELWPVVKRHLDWERRNFDPDGDGLYDAYCCIWASDALFYSGGDVTHSSAYNYFANRLAAEVALAIGEDPAPYAEYADRIGAAIDSVLWLPDRGHWAEYRDRLHHRRLHPSAALWTIYHAIDSEITDPLKAYAATRHIDRSIPHIPVVCPEAGEGFATLSTTDWKPYSWSINNVAIAEVMHTALAYWQARRPDDAYRLMMSVALDNMYLGASPLNFGQVSHYDAARGECYRDFADPVGVWSRALTEGLFGITPRMIGPDKVLAIRPGFPAEWDSASVSLPQVAYSFSRSGNRTVYKVANRYGNDSRLELTVPVNGRVSSVRVNGSPASWSSAELALVPTITIKAPSEIESLIEIETSAPATPVPTGRQRREGPVSFTEYTDGTLSWWNPSETRLAPAVTTPSPGFDSVDPSRLLMVDMSPVFNDSLSRIFRNQYLSPRPDVTTLQLPVQGIGEWCHPKLTAEISDEGLRSLLRSRAGVLTTDPGVKFRLASEGPNVLFTSLWDNYPSSASVKLPREKASHIYAVMAGSTNHMQMDLPNAVVRVRYTDGTEDSTFIQPPYNFAPIEQDYYFDSHAFALPEGTKPPYRLHLASGAVSRTLGDDLGITGVEPRSIPDGAAVLVDIPADPTKKLRSLELETLAGDVVVGLMGITIQKK